jgi:hypothetical protein
MQRIKAGLKRAVAQGTRLGRPKVDVALERPDGAHSTVQLRAILKNSD